MNVVTFLDDSSSENIRKSIFLIGSIMLFSIILELRITIPTSFLSSVKGESISFDYADYLIIFSVFQFYLAIRCFFSWRITKAKFKKVWIADEFDEKYNKLDLLKELDDFRDECKTILLPATIDGSEIREKISALIGVLDTLNTQCEKSLDANVHASDNCKNLLSTMTHTNRLMIDIVSKTDLLSETQKNQMLSNFPFIKQMNVTAVEPQFQADLNQVMNDYLGVIDEVKSKILPVSFRDLQGSHGELERVMSETITSFRDIEQVKNRCANFVEKFPESSFRLSLDIKVTDLTRARSFRGLEIDIFDFYIPVMIASVSVVVAICEVW